MTREFAAPRDHASRSQLKLRKALNAVLDGFAVLYALSYLAIVGLCIFGAPAAIVFCALK